MDRKIVLLDCSSPFLDIVYGWKFPNADENRNGRQQKRKEFSFLDCKLVVGYVFIGLSL